MTVTEQENIIALQKTQLDEKNEAIAELENVIQNMKSNPESAKTLSTGTSLSLDAPTHSRTKTKEQADELFSMLKGEIDDILMDDDDLPPEGVSINFDAGDDSDEEEVAAAKSADSPATDKVIPR